MGEQVRWNITVSREIDMDLRALLAERGGHEADLSDYVEEAVNRKMLGELIGKIHKRNAGQDPEEIERLIEQELAEVRKERRSRKA